jgi:hypothetical protein
LVLFAESCAPGHGVERRNDAGVVKLGLSELGRRLIALQGCLGHPEVGFEGIEIGT